jgi:hypothetical protein
MRLETRITLSIICDTMLETHNFNEIRHTFIGFNTCAARKINVFTITHYQILSIQKLVDPKILGLQPLKKFWGPDSRDPRKLRLWFHNGFNKILSDERGEFRHLFISILTTEPLHIKKNVCHS